MLVSELMRSDVKTCSPDDTLARAAQLMWENDIGVVPVVENDRVIGVLTDRDMCMSAFMQGKPLHEIRVSDVASKRLVTVSASDSLDVAEQRMREHQVRRLPVVMDGSNRLAGMLSLGDLARNIYRDAISSDSVGRTLEAISEPAGTRPATRPTRRKLELSPPGLAFVIATRAALGTGIGLLASAKLPSPVRRAVGLGLFALGAITTIPALRTISAGARAHA